MKGYISFLVLFATILLSALSTAQRYPYRPYGAVRSYYYSGAPAVAPYAAPYAAYAAAPVAAAPYAAAVLPDYYGLAASAALSYPGYGYGYGYPYLGAYAAGYPYVKK
ncbi:hypothetical protein JTE90_003312 [Oedothorax gibbosus]|uniref:Cuticle protein n=1 Tax=Oedothorax gibbosus TaxID=931172 RepID=A0AAV6TY00_9ARAC|nr:hypothetical protein JTE90_003312 [Oedothorax gibbosus]